jgi:hypothetical protein
MDQETAALLRSATEKLEKAAALLREVLPEREDPTPPVESPPNA